jgi:hypothetical protein
MTFIPNFMKIGILDKKLRGRHPHNKASKEILTDTGSLLTLFLSLKKKSKKKSVAAASRHPRFWRAGL